jgi:hypothetical protein
MIIKLETESAELGKSFILNGVFCNKYQLKRRLL